VALKCFVARVVFGGDKVGGKVGGKVEVTWDSVMEEKRIYVGALMV
jgi:hypothetical protein